LAALWRTRRLLRPVIAGLAVAVGLAIPLVGNVALEKATIGASLRAERATGTVQGAPANPLTDRLDEAMITATSLGESSGAQSYLIGGAVLALLTLFSIRASQGRAGRPIAVVAAGGIGALYVIRAVDGLGFVPGLIAATPLTAVGLALGWRRAGEESASQVDGRRLLLGVALLALPLVWALQFTGGAQPQWGARYILPSGFLLVTVGAVSLPLMERWARRAVVGLALAVTCFGLAWLSVRSHDVGRAEAALARRPEPVLVSRVAHLAREEAASARDQRWLTAVTSADEADAARVVGQAGVARFGLVELDADAVAHQIPGFDRKGTSRLQFLPGVTLRVTTYERSGG
jgi:hypothetical protein